MSIETRKLSIINWVSHLQDESVISRIEKLQSQKQDWWNLISDEEKAEIEEGISQADREETKTTVEVFLSIRNGFRKGWSNFVSRQRIEHSLLAMRNTQLN